MKIYIHLKNRLLTGRKPGKTVTDLFAQEIEKIHAESKRISAKMEETRQRAGRSTGDNNPFGAAPGPGKDAGKNEPLRFSWREDEDDRWTALGNSSSLSYHADRNCEDDREIMKAVLNAFFRADHDAAQFEQYQLENERIPQEVRQPVSDLKRFLNAGLKIVLTVISLMGAQPQTVNGRIRSDQPAAELQSIRGTVTDAKGDFLPGASVKIRGTNISTATDQNGVFEVRVNPSTAVLVISFMGFQTREIALAGAKLPLVIRLESSALQMQEVVVSTGYRDLPAGQATGSFVQLDKEILNRRVSTDIISRIEDVVPGLVFNRNRSTSANTASSGAISIRGQSTILGKADPLIVIDNFPYDGDLNNINPNDVESITVLKDAAAAAIWGARAGNGVIVITTKKGRSEGLAKVSFNSNVTVGEKPDMFYQPQMTSGEFIDIERMLFDSGYFRTTELSTSRQALSPVVELLIAKRDGLLPAAEADARIESLKQYDTRNDLRDHAYRRSLNRQYALDVSGGNEHQRYFLSAGYDRNQNSHQNTGYDRVTLHAKNSYALLKQKLELTAGAFLTKSNTRPDYFDYNPRYDLATSIPAYPYARLADDQGNHLPVNKDLRAAYAGSAQQQGLLDWQYRPLDEIGLRDHTQKLSDLRLNAAARYQVSSHLSADVLFLYNNTWNDSRNLQGLQTYYTRNMINTFTQVGADGTLSYPIPREGILDRSSSTAVNRNFRGQLNYAHTWKGKHDLDVLGGYEIKDLRTLSNSARMYGYDAENSRSRAVSYLTPYKRYQSSTGGTVTIPYSDAESVLTDRYRSYFGHAVYSFDRRYILSTSARLDQSNLFGVRANQKGVPLYSAGLGWNIHSEDFYQLAWLPYLKLRLSYGHNGNVYKSISALTTANTGSSYSATPNTGLPYATITNPPNPELQWERVSVLNLGLDFSSRNSRLGGSLEIYRKKGKDLIGNSVYDPTTGISSLRSNSAATRGTGFDLTLNSRNLVRQLRWNTGLLFSLIREKVTSYNIKSPGLNYPITTGLPLEGKPLYGIYSYPYAGLDSQTGDPMGYLDGQVSRDQTAILNAATPESLVYNGSSRPTWFGSFRNTFEWKNISLSAGIVYRGGYYFRKNTINYYSVLNGSNGHGDFSLRWQKPGDEAFTTVPSMPASANSRNDAVYLSSDLLALKGDHIRFQDISLAYNLSRSGIPKLPFNHVQLYLYANNLGMIWKANKYGIDPDYQQTGPPPRTVSLGLKLGL
jgi:TonB-dependent starch-binding outer membrane protein SusC